MLDVSGSDVRLLRVAEHYVNYLLDVSGSDVRLLSVAEH